MTTTATRHEAAAHALATLIPAATPVTAAPVTGAVPSSAASAAITASFVGAISADMAVALLEDALPGVPAGSDPAAVSLPDVVRPAMESAAGTLGPGVLGESRTEDASALFADAESAVFELAGHGTTAGWFAIRTRENGILDSTAGSVTPADREPIGARLGRINGVEMSLTVEIGRTRMSVRDVLNLEPGGVVELDRSAGAPADILLNGRIIAHGEVVVVDQDYAVRITRILDAAEGLG